MKQFTKEQNLIIENRDHNLLVSASAGTGKTTVMVERIAKLIADDKKHIDNFLVVTFTNLAAGEMKQRLIQKLHKEKNNPHVAEQLEKIETSNISTLHSFCVEVLRTYFYIADIDPNFAIVDDLSAFSLQNDAINAVYQNYYKSGDADFLKVYKIFVRGRKTTKLTEEIFNIYNKSRCKADFANFYQETRKNILEIDLPDNKLAMAIATDIHKNLSQYVKSLEKISQQAQQLKQFDFAEIIEENKSQICFKECNLQFALGIANSFKGVSPPRRTAKEKEREDFAEREILREKYSAVNKEIKKYLDNFKFDRDFTTLAKETKDTIAVLDKVVEIVSKFDQVYFEMKRQRGVVDYNDLEHLTLKILEDEEALQELKTKYKYIFVDEYQDTNNVQEKIISTLRGEKNLFYVGDVKQSIYGFRGCDPNNFVEKNHQYATEPQSKVIKLNQNFRSNNNILQFVNTIFKHTMTEDFGQVDYQNTAMLEGNNSESADFASVSIDIVAEAEKLETENLQLYDPTKMQDGDDFLMAEGKIVAHRISQIVGKTIKLDDNTTKKITYSDIAILSKSMTEKSLLLYNVLVQNNIPVVANFSSTSHQSKEIKDLVNFLKVLNNPLDDIAFVGMCLSFLGKLSHDEMAEIKICSPKEQESFLEKTLYYAENFQDEKATKLQDLHQLVEKMRFYSHSASVDEVLLLLLNTTNYHLFVSGLPNGSTRVRQLYQFIDGLKNKQHNQSVAKFLQHIENAGEVKSDNSLASNQAVQFMTMHKSKGLEFPVVFLVGLNSQQIKDKESLQFNLEMGLSCNYYDFESMHEYETLSQIAIKSANAKTQKEEEARVLYVAMTRPKNHLFLVASGADKFIEEPTKLISKYNSHAEWILSALYTEYGQDFRNGFSRDGVVLNVWDKHNLANLESEHKEENLLCKQNDDLESAIEKINYVYKFAQNTKLPTKVVSSQLDKDFLDLEEEPTYLIDPDNNLTMLGTAYHKILEIAKLDSTADDINEILDHLLDIGKVDKAVAELVDISLIVKTLNNQEFKNLLENGKIYHEIPFLLPISSTSVFAQQHNHDEKIILQGVIDLLVVKDGSAVVVDFKFIKNSFGAKKHYQKQLESYKMAVQKITGIEKVDAYIMSIADDKLIAMD